MADSTDLAVDTQGADVMHGAGGQSESKDDEEGTEVEGGLPATPPLPSSTQEVAEKDQEPPDMLGPPYASLTPPFMFWVELIAIALQSAFFGLFALGYLNVLYEVPKLWLQMQGNDAYPDDPSTTGFLDGNPIWIAIGVGTGLIVGLIKAFVFKFDEYPGFVEDIDALNADPFTSFKVAVVSIVSLMGGASLGPESGLGASCGGMSVLYARLVNYACRKWLRKISNGNEELIQKEEEKRRKLIFLAGMVSAFSSILPSPASSILLCLELGRFDRLTQVHGLEYMKTIVLLTFGGTISYVVYTSIEDDTYLVPPKDVPGFLHKFEYFDIVLALIFGAMGAGLGVVYFVIAGVVKIFVNKAKQLLQDRFGLEARIVLIAVIGGTLYGLLMYIFPLTPGDGSFQIGAVIVSGSQINSGVLAASTFAKMFSFWICNETGFVGGLFFPLMLMSSMFGRLVVNEWSDASVVICLACALVTLPASFTQMPLAMLLLALSMFNLSAKGSIPVLVCVVTANMLLAGIGIPQYMVSRAAQKKQAQAEKRED